MISEVKISELIEERKRLETEKLKLDRRIENLPYYISTKQFFKGDFNVDQEIKLSKNPSFIKRKKITERLMEIEHEMRIYKYSENPQLTLSKYREIQKQIKSLDSKIAKVPYIFNDRRIYSKEYSSKARKEYFTKRNQCKLYKNREKLFHDLLLKMMQFFNDVDLFSLKLDTYTGDGKENQNPVISYIIANCLLDDAEMDNIRNNIETGYYHWCTEEEYWPYVVFGMHLILEKLALLEGNGAISLVYKRIFEFINKAYSGKDFEYLIEFIKNHYNTARIKPESIKTLSKEIKSKRKKLEHKNRIKIYQRIIDHMKSGNWVLPIKDFCTFLNINKDEALNIIDQFNAFNKGKKYSLNKNITVDNITGNTNDISIVLYLIR